MKDQSVFSLIWDQFFQSGWVHFRPHLWPEWIRIRFLRHFCTNYQNNPVRHQWRQSPVSSLPPDGQSCGRVPPCPCGCSGRVHSFLSESASRQCHYCFPSVSDRFLSRENLWSPEYRRCYPFPADTGAARFPDKWQWFWYVLSVQSCPARSASVPHQTRPLHCGLILSHRSGTVSFEYHYWYWYM